MKILGTFSLFVKEVLPSNYESNLSLVEKKEREKS